ncbi:nuclear mRNA export, poly(A)+RNA binding protein [Linnemannia exigua]|uniref:Nuclear mRNA export, poly(A)+RNA binding protein n=1 Tax=Linnemannia exigua TaxID=604196 RepID=A0AAD4H885_9FUNG|nr:nuclear mRNA export, poly(A)+RNA binding protein [Linnemannia exigua]
MNNRGRGRGLFRGSRGSQGGGSGQGGGGGGNTLNSNNNGNGNNQQNNNNHNNGGGGRGGGRGGRGGGSGGSGNYRGFSGFNGNGNGNGHGRGGGLVGGLGQHRTNFKRGNKSGRGSQANSLLRFRRGRHNTQPRFGNGNRGGGWASGSGNNSNSRQGQGQGQGQDQGRIIVFVKCKNKGQGSGQGSGQGVLGDPGLIEFLTEKTLPTVIEASNRRYYDHKDQTSFLVGDIGQAKALRALSGIRYNSHKLVITTSADGALSGASNRQGGDRQINATYSLSDVETVRSFIKSRANGSYLNLERMVGDSILRDGHVTSPGQNPDYDDFGPLIFRIAAELYPEVTTISLGFNGLISLQSVSSLSQYFPDLLHLSLRGNNISSLEELHYIGGDDKLLLLEELVLKDNPVWEEEIKIRATGSDGGYKTTLSNFFPKLLILDDDKIERVKLGHDVSMDELEFAKVALPVPIRGNYFDSRDTQSTVLEFLTSNDARFSCTVIQSESLTPQQDDANGYQKGQWNQNAPVQRNVWTEYSSRSRNLKATKDTNKVMSTLFVGNQVIVQNVLSKLPRTRHDLSDDSKICVDALRGINALQRDYIFVSVHGEYEELRRGASSQPVRKSFDRTFILVDASLNSIASNNGWKCLILSDHLTVREYNGYESWKPQPAMNIDPSLAAALDNTDSTVALRHPDGLSGKQHSMAEELMRHTGLTYQYSIQALVANGWNPEHTLTFIQSSLNNLPSHAWHLG